LQKEGRVSEDPEQKESCAETRPATAATMLSSQPSERFEMGAGLVSNGAVDAPTPADFYGTEAEKKVADVNADLCAVEDNEAEVVGKKKKRKKNKKKKKKDGAENTESNTS